MRTIIETNKLSKRYTINGNKPNFSLRDKLDSFIKKPISIFDKEDKKIFWALKDISFKVYPGEVLGLIGKNGAGKSTLLKILSQITPPTSGSAILRGRVSSLLEVGTGFHEELTGRENIYLNGAILGMKRREIKRRFDEIVDFSEVEKFLDTPVKFYSSGMHARLAFSVAAFLESEILLVDEVLAVGDAEFQKKSLGKIENIAENKGKTIIFVSHNLSSVSSICSRGILLDEGKIVCEGQIKTVINKYIGDISEFYKHKNPINVLLSDHGKRAEYLRLNKVSILSLDNKLLKPIPYDSPFRIKVEAEVIKPVKNCRLGLSIETTDGFRIATIYNTDGGDHALNFSKGKVTWEVEILDNILTPGEYNFGLSIVKVIANPYIAGEEIEHIQPIMSFEISDLVGDIYHPKYSIGPAKIKNRWF